RNLTGVLRNGTGDGACHGGYHRKQRALTLTLSRSTGRGDECAMRGDHFADAVSAFGAVPRYSFTCVSKSFSVTVSTWIGSMKRLSCERTRSATSSCCLISRISFWLCASLELSIATVEPTDAA